MEIKYKRAYFEDENKTEFIKFIEWGIGIGDSVFASPTHMSSANSFIDCRFTGTKDKAKNELWDGDIVEYKVRCYEVGKTSETIKSFIFWDEMKAGFYIAPLHMFDHYSTGKNGYLKGDHLNAKNKLKVGNIYENPELLKT